VAPGEEVRLHRPEAAFLACLGKSHQLPLIQSKRDDSLSSPTPFILFTAGGSSWWITGERGVSIEFISMTSIAV